MTETRVAQRQSSGSDDHGKGPVVVVLGATGSGKSAVGAALAGLLQVDLVENEGRAEQRWGRSRSEQMIEDPEGALEALKEAARECLSPAGPAAGNVVVLNASAPLDQALAERIRELRSQGTAVIATTASLETLVRRNGLNAPQPPGLGTPRAWFRGQLAALTEAYSPLVDLWCDTGAGNPAACAQWIADQLELPRDGGQEN